MQSKNGSRERYGRWLWELQKGRLCITLPALCSGRPVTVRCHANGAPVRDINAMKTFSAKEDAVRREWFVVDATDKTLGRLASEIATRLRGKHKPEFTPHADVGDYIVVVNAEKVRVTGAKLTDKMYHSYTGYIGNLKSISLEKLLQKAPERVIEKAVKGMLPRNPLGRKMFRKLRVFRGPDHKHAAQRPTPLEL